MGVIQTKDGLFRVFNNWLDCPHRGNCEGQEEREKRLGKIFIDSRLSRCYSNPSIKKCEFYQKFNPQFDIEEIYDLRGL